MTSRDSGKIALGVAIFLVLVSFPIWYTGTHGQSRYRPELEYPVGEKACVESTEYMKASHMRLLNEWRNSVVRKSVRTYISNADHHQYDMSLEGTCLKCHQNKAAFCDRCHNYVGVSPGCWDCHVAPQGGLLDGKK